MKHSIILSIALCVPTTFIAQTNSGDLEAYIGTYIGSIPGSSGDDFQAPSSAQLSSWSNMIDALFVDDLTSSRLIADSLNYQIVEYTDTQMGELHYVLEEKTSRINYWGMFVFNAAPCRSGLVLQAPHPKFDFNTGKEAAFCYARLSARALFISGTHRCNHSGFSTCDGSTSVCQGTSSSYQESDNAHTVQSVFQQSTAVVNSSISNAVFIQLHGFSKLATDPYVIMSNGTRDTPTVDYVDLIKSGLSTADPTLTFEIAHVNLSWTRLIAFTNTQGRLLNQSSDPCDTHLDISTGKFVHIEQEKTKLRDDSTGWYKVYSALSDVFICDTSTAGLLYPAQNELLVFPNPIASQELTVRGDGVIGYKLIDARGKLIASEEYIEISEIKIDFKELESGVYFARISTKLGNNIYRIVKQ
ncbi:MAG: hypothetical protein ACI865_001325 [Flavobacteriaceae bacterium]|jgi:hypothetical protein